ncbi:SMP-30/gluconolactonase/LRE family protein [Acidocella sp.]|uniref:SMP-30/gluconolactonase/LRE family protein n=1 Tax=Acidocella sp. TaxID=50710 RepID=UPI0026357EA4|nr:SMP-30/gluconolactonase/LRE family protein [Acidocella sp.]
MKLELVTNAKAIIGESLLWVPEEGRLYWADIKAPALYALDHASGETRRWELPADLGGFALDGKGRAFLALRNGLHWLDLTSGALEMVAPPPFDTRLIRFNESGCDSQGRFWVGTMTDPPAGVETTRTGALYSYTSREGLRAYPDFSFITNGMAWSADERGMFLSRSEERTIYRYAYDVRSGRLGERQIFAIVEGEGIPDGAALDETGIYWCAIHGGWALHGYDPSGQLVERVSLPVSQPTMCCFAGPDLDWLYISSARDGLDAAQIAREPQAGGLFRLQVNRRGQKRHWRVA